MTDNLVEAVQLLTFWISFFFFNAISEKYQISMWAHLIISAALEQHLIMGYFHIAFIQKKQV